MSLDELVKTTSSFQDVVRCHKTTASHLSGKIIIVPSYNGKNGSSFKSPIHLFMLS